MFKALKSNKGFSLVELMIVVAIIGILASVAIPNFQRFQRKARQSEAKSQLSAVFSAQKATQAEFNVYCGNFPAIGFKPDGELTYRIATANNASCATAGVGNGPVAGYDAACVITSAACANGYKTWIEKPAGAANKVGPSASTPYVAATTDTTFLATAGAFIGGATLDSWSMNENKVFANTSGL